MSPRLLAWPLLVAIAGIVALLLWPGRNPPPDDAALLVPSGASAYFHVGRDPESEPWQRALKALERLPAAEGTLAGLRSTVAELAGVGDPAAIEAWLGREVAVAVFADAAGRRRRLLLLEARDERAARRFAARRGRPLARHRGATLFGSPRLAATFAHGFVLAGAPAALRRALDASASPAMPLARTRAYRRLTGRLSGDTIAHAYLDEDGIDRFAPGARRLLAALAGAARTGPAAISLDLDGDEVGRLRLRARADWGGGRCPGRPDESALLDVAPAEAAGYASVARPGCALEALLARPGGSRRALSTGPAGPLGQALRRLARRIGRAARSGGVDAARDLRPLLGGEAALLVTPAEAGPAITLVLDGVDERRALDVMGRLQAPLLRFVRPTRVGGSPVFEAHEVEGVPTLTAALAPGLELSYAAFDGRLAVSTAPEGIAAAHGGDGGLSDGDSFDFVLGDRPQRPSAVLFLDLDQLLALGEQAGLDADPSFLAARDDLQKLRAVGASLTREEDYINAEILFKTP